MRSKTSRQRVIDIPVDPAPDANPPIASTASLTGPAIPTLPAPQNLTVASNVTYQSAVTPSALIGLSWNAPVGVSVTSYVVQSATDSGFTAGVTTNTVAGTDTSARLILPAGQLTYFRVAAVYGQIQGAWSSTASATTASDTTAPAVPTSLSAAFNSAGDLLIGWTNPTSANFREVEVTICADSGFTTQLYQEGSATGAILWTAAQNRQAGSGTPDPTLFVRMRSRSWSNVYSAYVSPGTQPTKTVPGNVSGVSHSWSGDAGAAGADWIISWSAISGALFYRLTIDGQQRDVYGTRYTYTLDTNRAEHSGTPDPSLSYSLIAVDGLDQVSATPTSGTATNAAPAAPSAATATAFFTSLSISVSTALPADGIAYRFRLIQTSPSASDITWDSPSPLHTREISASATYQVGLRIVDAFGQQSSETLSSTVVADALTLADLRSSALYSDSLSTAAATLKAALADDNRSSGGISYSSNASWVRWIRFERSLSDRYRTITLSMTPASGTTNWYLRTSSDGSAWSYWSGPVTSSRILTSVASEAAAQSAAVSAATLGNSSASRVDLPSIVDARYIEVWLRNTAASTRVDEFYPRRLVQSDDIEAESIRAINIAAATITADRLSVSQLSAIAADLGTITAGTVTGALIRTAASGARVEMDATDITGYNSGGSQLWAISGSGMQIVPATSSRDATRAYLFHNGTLEQGGMYGVLAASSHSVEVIANSLASRHGSSAVGAEAPATYRANVDIYARSDAGGSSNTTSIKVRSDDAASGAVNGVFISGAGVALESIGSTDIPAGELRAPGAIHPVRSSGSALFAIDGTTQGSQITIANTATAYPFGNADNFSGLIIINPTTVNGGVGLFLTGGTGVTLVASSVGSLYTTTAATASRINVYLGGTSGFAVVIENRLGASVNLNVIAIRTRTSQ